MDWINSGRLTRNTALQIVGAAVLGLVLMSLAGAAFSIAALDSDWDAPLAHLFVSDACCGGDSGGGDSGGGGDSYYQSSYQSQSSYYEYKTPSCDIWASATYVQYGDSVTLTWTSSNAKYASIDNGIGSVSLSGSHTVHNITSETTFTLTVKNKYDTKKKCSVTVKVRPQTPPSCAITANLNYVNKGSSSVLSWTSSNATSATLNQGIGSVSTNGSKSVTPQQSTTYTLTVTGPGGTADCSVTITVKTPKTPSCSIWADRTWIEKGQSAVITWNSQNAHTAVLNQGIGSVSLSGSTTVSPTQTKTYVLTVTGEGGTADCSVTITVEEKEAPTCWISANPSNVSYNGSVTLTWGSTNAHTAHISPEIGSVSVNGSRTINNLTYNKTYTLTVTGDGGTAQCYSQITVDQQVAPSCSIWANRTHVENGGSVTLNWNSSYAQSATLTDYGSVAVNGSQTVWPYATKTYTLTVYSASGQSAQCQTTIYVDQQSQDPHCSIWASPSSVQSGQSSTLSWNSQNAYSASISSIGSVSTNGSRSVSPTYTTTYTMTVYGNSGKTAQCHTTIGVTSIPYNNPPSCTITLTQPQWNFGYSKATLTWWSTNATSAHISPDIGSVAVAGTRDVYPASNTQYTMTVYGPGGSATCYTQYVNPGQPYVALTQIPYTGFDFGPVGNTLYWLGLILLAIGGAYLMVYRRPRFAFASAGHARTSLPSQIAYAARNQYRGAASVIALAAGPIQSMLDRYFSGKKTAAASIAPVTEMTAEAPVAATMQVRDRLEVIEGDSPRIVITRG